MKIPEQVLKSHIAVLGKTGSGKTNTAKLCIEQVVAAGHRVCVLDPVKSDYWGLTSSADGKRPGLPFQILGGPHGHVPLHDAAGAAIGELVATGALPLSIIDMADFKAGGPNRFFTEFVDTLMRKMRGVLYLVVEEAHEFAPKERSGVGDENMGVYYAKKLATAGRTKGIRLIACSQSVQQLHNRVLGSCETLIVHRFSAPADQKPVFDWLKGNVESKAEQAAIKTSLRNLADGEGWICSSAMPLERVQFPRIHTFDNSRTPTLDDGAHQVVTAKVDQAALRELVGAAVTEAEANDPAKLNAEIVKLRKELAAAKTAKPAVAAPTKATVQIREVVREVLPEAWLDRAGKFLRIDIEKLRQQSARVSDDMGKLIDRAETLNAGWDLLVRDLRAEVDAGKGRRGDAQAGEFALGPAPRGEEPAEPRPAADSAPPVLSRVEGPADDVEDSDGERRILSALAQYPEGRTKKQVAILSRYSPKGGGFRRHLAELRRRGLIADRGDLLAITDDGRGALGDFEPLPQGRALFDHWLNKLGATERAVLNVVYGEYPEARPKQYIATKAGYQATGGGFRRAMARLRQFELIEGKAKIKASPALFQEAS
jgi:hypothetical protein